MDAVDLVKYPGFSEVPWWEAQMEAGDCLYIPIFWHHQVTSTADPARKRNMAVNTWFFTLNRFNHSDCEAGSQETGEVPLDTVAGTSKPKKSEIIRYTDILLIKGDSTVATISVKGAGGNHWTFCVAVIVKKVKC